MDVDTSMTSASLVVCEAPFMPTEAMMREQLTGTLDKVNPFRGMRIVVLGLARQGLALARFFTAYGADVTISDMSPAEKLAAELGSAGALPVKVVLGGHPLELLDDCDLVCLSGGVPPQIEIVQEAIRRGIPLSNDSLLTLQLARQRGLGPTIAITGSSGKTTTTTLVGEMLAASGLNPHVGGNIGAPLIDRLDDIEPGQPIVLELSSFQLEMFDPQVAWEGMDLVGPDVAAILNITPNHLDRHSSMSAYAEAKFNLLRCLLPGATVVVSADDAVTGRIAAQRVPLLAGRTVPAEWEMESSLQSVCSSLLHTDVSMQPISREQTLPFGAWMEEGNLVYNHQVFTHRDDVRLRGEHNISNLLAAAAISGAARATLESMKQVAQTFEGVRHRLEVVKEYGGVTWINDSIATSPERAVAGLRSFDPSRDSLILLAGGKDKKLPWNEFAEEVLQRVGYLIGFGHSGAMIVETVRGLAESTQRTVPGTAIVLRLEEAVELAARSARPGTVVLLSPGGTSYDAYRDFEARGEHFRALVEQYAGLALRSAADG
jgi:UDP-N-acetylmuramoylalanine--D-glutamate ligase